MKKIDLDEKVFELRAWPRIEGKGSFKDGMCWTKRDILKAALPIIEELYEEFPDKEDSMHCVGTEPFLDYLNSLIYEKDR